MRHKRVEIVATDGAPLVPWWSFTKTVIAAALTMVRDRALVLDQPVSDAPYTLRQLLQHTAGLGGYFEVPDHQSAVTHGEDPWRIGDSLRHSRADRLRYSPGSGWRYSNVGYQGL